MDVVIQRVSKIGLNAEAVAVVVVQRESISLVSIHRNLCQLTVHIVETCAATGEVRTIVTSIGISALAAELEFVVLRVKEGQTDESGGLDTVEAVTGTLAVLHLRSIGVGTDVGVTFPTIGSSLIACTE